mmetsp:Transcript_11498/g.34624  ORF Transcript_11498/g.34624 Transcript_11498/m.34624 type:complete len:233 (+) Transcript_11498:1-699(+)
MGLAHVACLVRQAEMSVKEWEDQRTGEGFMKWNTCFDCGQSFHGPVLLALSWAAWKMYLGLPENNGTRWGCMSLLGDALRSNGRCAEALPVMEAHLALTRRGWSHEQEYVLASQTNVSTCLSAVGRHNEALAILREVYAGWVAKRGVSYHETIKCGSNLAASLARAGFWDEGSTLLRDQLLPAARQSLGADDDLTLAINESLAMALHNNPEHTRNGRRFESTPSGGVDTPRF